MIQTDGLAVSILFEKKAISNSKFKYNPNTQEYVYIDELSEEQLSLLATKK